MPRTTDGRDVRTCGMIEDVVRRLALGLLVTAGCLDPQVSDEVDASRVFGDPELEAAQLPHVEENVDLADNVARFPTDIPYAQAYASGRKVWYWRVPPPLTDFIVPIYVLVGPDGQPMQRPIIDVIPGDTGYSPWWRVVRVPVTDAYAGEHIWSREAIDLGVQMGLLEAPVPTERVVTCPVVRSDVRVQVDQDGTTVAPTWALYRNQRVDWIEFDSDITVSVEDRRMPIAPFFVFQRIDEPFPLVELDAGFDLDGDGSLSASNNIFQFDVGEVGYTPFWYPVRVRTVSDFVSIDTASTADQLEFTGEDDFLGPVYGVVTSDRVIPPLMEMKDQLRNCPIQREPGRL